MSEIEDIRPALRATGLTHRYGAVLALDNVSVEVPIGGFVAVLGANGAGKSTLGLILAGALAPTKGTVRCGGHNALALGKGISIVPEGRRLFGQLSIRENLLLGGCGGPKSSRAVMRARMEELLKQLPKTLQDDPERKAATLSGGEQQMLAIGRALMSDPQLLVIDEPSLGLAPILVEQVYDTLRSLNKRGVTIVLLEQMAMHAIQNADQLLVLDRGRLIYQGTPHGEEARDALIAGYIG
jgi:branched-chain amino acid transport system ATP-binding protein